MEAKERLVKKTKKVNHRKIFYICMAAWPVVQFLVFYLYVNFNSILLSFQKFDYLNKGYEFVGFDNYREIFHDLFNDPVMKLAIKNTVQIFGISLISMFIPIILSYYIFKKYWANGIFKVVLFLPSIISSMAIVVCYKYFVENAIPVICEKWFHKDIEGLLSNLNTRWGTIIFFNIWMGVGTNFLLYLGAMTGISDSVFEAAQLDGANPFQEFTRIVFPMIFPTFSTFVITSFAVLFTNQAHVFTFYGSEANYSIYTIGYFLYSEAQSAQISDYPYLACMGIVLTFAAVPLCLGTKWLLARLGPKTE